MRTISRRSLLSLPLAMPFLKWTSRPASAPVSSSQIHYDTIVIGAGAAGLAAARTLQAAGKSVLILEARDRIGGRINTNYSFAPHPIECGAEYLQGEKILTWNWVNRYRLGTLPAFAQDEQQLMYIDRKLLPFSSWSKIPGIEVLNLLQDSAISDMLTAWIDAGKPDLSLAQFLTTNQISLSPDIYQIVDYFFSESYGANLDQLGVYGLMELTYAGDGDRNFRLTKGYADLLDRFAAGLNIRYATPVTSISWISSGVTIHPAIGAAYTAKQVVITVPLAILQNNDLKFEPKLPQAKLTAIQGIGTGHITKLILKFDRPFWAKNMESCSTTLDTHLWWRPGWGRNNEAPILTAFTGAVGAEKLGRLEKTGAIQAGLSDLEQMFGLPLVDRLVDGLFIDWQSDPYAKMAYSYTPVNGQGLRAQLAQSVDRVLFFAGEATHVTRAATVHGALESGIRAADEILSLAIFDR
jgi:monoamine oxidase